MEDEEEGLVVANPINQIQVLVDEVSHIVRETPEIGYVLATEQDWMGRRSCTASSPYFEFILGLLSQPNTKLAADTRVEDTTVHDAVFLATHDENAFLRNEKYHHRLTYNEAKMQELIYLVTARWQPAIEVNLFFFILNPNSVTDPFVCIFRKDPGRPHELFSFLYGLRNIRGFVATTNEDQEETDIMYRTKGALNSIDAARGVGYAAMAVAGLQEELREAADDDEE